MKILLRGGNVYTGNRFTASDILIAGGRIVSIADNIDNIEIVQGFGGIKTYDEFISKD